MLVQLRALKHFPGLTRERGKKKKKTFGQLRVLGLNPVSSFCSQLILILATDLVNNYFHCISFPTYLRMQTTNSTAKENKKKTRKFIHWCLLRKSFKQLLIKIIKDFEYWTSVGAHHVSNGFSIISKLSQLLVFEKKKVGWIENL